MKFISNSKFYFKLILFLVYIFSIIIAIIYIDNWVKFFIVFLLSFILLILFFTQSYKDPLQPLNWMILSYLIYIIGPSIYMIYYNYNLIGLEYLTIEESISILSLSLFYFLLGFISFLIGYFIDQFIKNKREHKFFKNVLIKLNKKRVIFAIVILFFIGFSGYVILNYKLGNGIGIKPNSLMKSIEARSMLVKGSNKFFFLFTLFLRIAIIIWFAYLLQRNKVYHFQFYIILIIVLFIYYNLGGRKRLMSIPILMIIVYHYLYKKISIVYFIYIIIIILLIPTIILPALSGGLGDITSLSHVFKKIYEKRNFDLIYNFTLLIKKIDNIRFYYGLTIIGDLLSDFPYINKIFPSSRYVFMSNFFKNIYRKGVSMPGSYPGVLFLNFGVLGIIFGMFLYGLFCKVLYKYMIFDKSNPNKIIIYALIAHKIGINGWFFIMPIDLVQIFIIVIVLQFISKKSKIK